jgi:hypothetical protein
VGLGLEMLCACCMKVFTVSFNYRLSLPPTV